MRKHNWKYTEEQLTNAVKNSFSISGVLRYLNLDTRGGNNTTLKRRINLLKLDISHFNPYNRSDKAGFVKRTSIKHKDITLQIDHINGINTDHRLENLRFLCPNCHSQTDTFCGRNLPKMDKKVNFCGCGSKIDNKAFMCLTCRAFKDERIIWPSKEELEIMVWTKSTRDLSKELGISDVAIAKRCKKYGIKKPERGYWNKQYANR